MQVAVISDIHGNHIAFQKAIDYLKTRNVDAYCILGDYSGEFAGVTETLDMIYDLQEKFPVYMIKGNKEDYLMCGIGGVHPEWDDYPSTVGMLRYAYESMREKDWEFIKSLPETRKVCFEGMEDLLLCHGTPRKVKEDLRKGNPENKNILKKVSAKYILCGHTHETAIFEEYGKHVFNPGSIGNPLNERSNDKSTFMILHSVGKEWEAEQINLKQEVDVVMQSMIEKNLHNRAPYWCRATEAYLRGSTKHNGDILMKAMELTLRETGECNWPVIPEKYWEQAFKEMIIEKNTDAYQKMKLKVAQTFAIV